MAHVIYLPLDVYKRQVGYRAQLQGTKLVLSVGKSHQDEVEAPENIKFVVATPTSIVVEGISKEAVGQTAAYIRSRRSPEPYKGKGDVYKREHHGLSGDFYCFGNNCFKFICQSAYCKEGRGKPEKIN